MSSSFLPFYKEYLFYELINLTMQIQCLASSNTSSKSCVRAMKRISSRQASCPALATFTSSFLDMQKRLQHLFQRLSETIFIHFRVALEQITARESSLHLEKNMILTANNDPFSPFERKFYPSPCPLPPIIGILAIYGSIIL